MRVRRLAALMALLMVMSGCGAQPEPVTIETLRVEISKNDQSSQSLLQEVRELPELLKAGFDAIAEETGVEVGEVTVTVGTSPAATAQALAEGSVDLAFLPAADLIRSGGDAVAVLAEAENSGLSNAGEVPADWNGSEHATALVPGVQQAGTFSLVCAAPHRLWCTALHPGGERTGTHLGGIEPGPLGRIVPGFPGRLGLPCGVAGGKL